MKYRDTRRPWVKLLAPLLLAAMMLVALDKWGFGAMAMVYAAATLAMVETLFWTAFSVRNRKLDEHLEDEGGPW